MATVATLFRLCGIHLFKNIRETDQVVYYNHESVCSTKEAETRIRASWELEA